MTEQEIEHYFLQAFDNIKDSLLSCKKDIVEKIEAYIEEQKNANPKLLIVNSPEARIKHKNQIWAKLNRNEKIKSHHFETEYDIHKYEKYIRENLSDLIGLRIICYFKNDARDLFDSLKIYLDQNKQLFLEHHDDLVIKNIKGMSNHDIEILKLQGIYKFNSEQYCFEIQLKSMSDDLWGEVDHEIVYKAKQFQYDDKETKELSNNIHNTLIASDNELKTLFEKEYDKDDLINSLYFYISNETCFPYNKFQINKYYHIFFDIFNTPQNRNDITTYVGNDLLKSSFHKIQFTVNNSEEVVLFANEILAKNLKKELLVIKPIVLELYNFEHAEDYFNYISSNLLSGYFEDPDTDQACNEDEFQEIKTDFEKKLQLLNLAEKKNDRYKTHFFSFAYLLKDDAKSAEIIKQYQDIYINLIKILNKEFI